MPKVSSTVVIHQPDFIPYLGFFHRLLQTDIWIVLDHIQLNKAGWVHRDKLKTPNGVKWISIPLKKCHLSTRIMDALIAEGPWREKHLNQWHSFYHTTPYWQNILPYLEDIYANSSSTLMGFTMYSIEVMLKLFGIHVPRIIYSSELQPKYTSNALVAELTRKVDSTRYLSGTGARNYFESTPFIEAGVEVFWQHFTHPIYSQPYGPFEPNLSAFDILFNCGIAKSRILLQMALEETSI